MKHAGMYVGIAAVAALMIWATFNVKAVGDFLGPKKAA